MPKLRSRVPHDLVLPTFFILGASKSGTTSLFRCLRQHPDVYLPPGKETHFFEIDRNYRRGLAFYSSTYFGGKQRYPARGDATPSYLHLPELVGPRIREALGGIRPRFVVILRDPTSRAWSHYLHRVRVAAESLDFEHALSAEEARLRADPTEWAGYFCEGLYAPQLERWFGLFGRDRFLVHLTDDLSDKAAKTVFRTLAFLDVETVPLEMPARCNEAARPRSKRLMSFLTHSSRLKAPARVLLPLDFRVRLKEFLRRQNLRPFVSRPAMPEETELRLRERYAASVGDLQRLIGRDLSAWLPPVRGERPERSASAIATRPTST
jgi:hypothetical protein